MTLHKCAPSLSCKPQIEERYMCASVRLNALHTPQAYASKLKFTNINGSDLKMTFHYVRPKKSCKPHIYERHLCASVRLNAPRTPQACTSKSNFTNIKGSD